MEKEVGQTQDSGFEIGVRRTIATTVEATWSYLVSQYGVDLWLGDIIAGDMTVDSPYQTREGVSGKLTVLTPNSHLRLTWKKAGWSNSSILQIRVLPAATGTTIAFHQEKLLDSQQREEMKVHWETMLERLAKVLVK